jgi:uncharacterized membrane protein YgaE (UPF0421/DUF939 family)
MAAVRERLRDPVVWGNAFQLVKTVGAAVAAWALARTVFGLPQPFLAPWAAMLTVHATVYRSLTRGLQQVGAAVLGVLLAFGFGSAFGVNAASLALALLVAMTAGTTRALRAESTTAAATALVVLLAGYSGDPGMLGARLLDTVIGIAVGLIVNVLIWPPLRDRSAARQVDNIAGHLGALLADVAGELREDRADADAERWVERTRGLDHDIADAWAVFQQARESGRLNLRRAAPGRVHRSRELLPMLARLEQAVADTRSMASTLERCVRGAQCDREFLDAWVALLARAGDAVCAGDRGRIRAVRADLERVADEDGARRPVHGALMVNLRNVLDAMAAVVEAQPVRVRSPRVAVLTSDRQPVG